MTPINHIKLSELNQKIEDVLNNNFKNSVYWIVADISNHNFKEKTNYHFFEFVEKDTDTNQIIAKTSGKAWSVGSKKIQNFESITGQKFTNNIHILVSVKVTYHKALGISLEVVDIDPNFTLGVIEQQRQATLLRLITESSEFINKVGDKYVTRNSQLNLPVVIQKIAVVSSKSSAGLEDFIHTLISNQFNYKFEIHQYHTIVQNDANAKTFHDTLLSVFYSKINYDVIVIIRGGGAQTDFLIFDNYHIGKAIAKFPIPILTGIGHHKNETIADLMAHTQTKTPTKCAEYILEVNRSFEESLLQLQKNILIKSQQILSIRFQKLAILNNSILNKCNFIISKNKDNLVKSNQIVINNTKSILYNLKNDIDTKNQNIVNKSKSIIFSNHSYLIKTISTIINKPKTIIYNFKNEIDTKNQTIFNKSKNIIFRNHSILINTISNIVTKPKIIVNSKKSEISNTINNLSTFNSIYLRNKRSFLNHNISVINLMSPENILKKGFAIIKKNNQVISDPNLIPVGSKIDIILSDKVINSTVNNKSEYNGTEFKV